MAEVRQIRGPLIHSDRLENEITYQVDPNLPELNRGPLALTIIPADPTGTLSGSLLLQHGMMSYTMDLSAGDWYRRLGLLSSFTIAPTGLNPAEKFSIKFLW